MTDRDDEALFRAVTAGTCDVDQLLAELDITALADAVGVLRAGPVERAWS